MTAINTARRTLNSGWATTPARYVAISLFWLSISLFWAMALSEIIQLKVVEFVGDAHKGAGVAIIATGGAVAAGLIQLFIGPISDRCRMRWGRRRPFLFWGALGGAAAMVLFSYANTFPLMIAAFVGIQILLNIANGPYQAMIPDHAPRDHQGRAAATMGLMQLLGEGGGPLMAGLVIDQAVHHPGYALARLFHATNQALALRHLLIVDAVMIVAFMLVTVLIVPDSPCQSDVERVPLNPFRDLNIRENADFFRLIVSRTFYNLGFYIALNFLLYYVQDSLGLGSYAPKNAALLQATAVVFAAVGTVPAGWFADRGYKKSAVYLSCAFSGIAGIAFALSPGIAFSLVTGGLFGIGYGLFRAVDWAFACNLLPKTGGAARWLAIWSLTQLVPQILAPGWGPIGDALNHWRPGLGWRLAMVACTVCVLAGAAVVSTIKEPSLTDENEGTMITE